MNVIELQDIRRKKAELKKVRREGIDVSFTENTKYEMTNGKIVSPCKLAVAAVNRMRDNVSGMELGQETESDLIIDMLINSADLFRAAFIQGLNWNKEE
jgi:hypothetical protein